MSDTKIDARVCMVCGQIGSWTHLFMCNPCLEGAIKAAFLDERMIKMSQKTMCQRCDGSEQLRFRDYHYSCKEDGKCTRNGWEIDPVEMAELLPDLEEFDFYNEAATLSGKLTQVQLERDSLTREKVELVKSLDDTKKSLATEQAALSACKRELSHALNSLNVLREELGLIKKREG